MDHFNLLNIKHTIILSLKWPASICQFHWIGKYTHLYWPGKINSQKITELTYTDQTSLSGVLR